MSVLRLKRAQLRERKEEREWRTMWPAAGEPGRHEVVGLVACSAVRLRLRLRGSGPRLGAAQEPKRFRALRWQHPRSNKTRTVRASDVCVPRLCMCVCVQNCLCLCVCVCSVRGVENWLHFKNPQDAEQNVKRKGKSKRRSEAECVARNQSKVKCEFCATNSNCRGNFYIIKR